MSILQIAIEDLKKALGVVNLLINYEQSKQEIEERNEAPPQHVWKHGDVFESYGGETMLCFRDIQKGHSKSRLRTICLDDGLNGCKIHEGFTFLPSGTFLFNIKEKL